MSSSGTFFLSWTQKPYEGELEIRSSLPVSEASLAEKEINKVEIKQPREKKELGSEGKKVTIK